MKSFLSSLFFLLSGCAYCQGILNEELLDSDSIQKLQLELQELDGITSVRKTTTDEPTEDLVIQDEQTTSSSAVKKQDSQEQNLKDLPDYIELDRFF